MTILTAVIIISAAMLAISLSMGLNSIAENQINLYQSKSQQVLMNAEGCADEALIRLNRDNNYTGETLDLDDTQCTISVSGTGNNRTIDIQAVEEPYTKNLRIEVIFSPTFSIDSWEETED